MRKTISYDNMSVSSESMFTKCCCCFSLRVGCLILGYLSLILHTFHTLALVLLTSYIGIETHGFDHFDEPLEDEPGVEPVTEQKPFLTQIGILLLVVLCANTMWLIVNIACLVGIHKKRPGPIRIYVAFATIRLLLALAGFLYLMITGRVTDGQSIVTHCADIGLAAYFILVYYVYSVQLQREQATSHIEQNAFTNDIAIIIPAKTDKERLVI